MSEITEQLKHYPEMVAFIESEFHHPIEDVAGIQYSQGITKWYEYTDAWTPFHKQMLIPVDQTLTVTFVDGDEQSAFLNGKRFSYVEVLPEEQAE